MKQLVAAAIVLGLAGSACSGTFASDPNTTTTTTQLPPEVTPPARPCEAPVDTPIDVAGEPPWRQFADYRTWTDQFGCLVRIDVLAERPGPDHCGWEDTRVLITGESLGTIYRDTTDSIEYVRDPNGLYGVPELAAGFAVLDDLPADAIDSGYRSGDRELWLSAADPGAIYILDRGVVERWPAGVVPPCA